MICDLKYFDDAVRIQIVFEYKSQIFLQIQIQILVFVKFQIQKVFEYLEYLTPGLLHTFIVFIYLFTGIYIALMLKACSNGCK